MFAVFWCRHRNIFCFVDIDIFLSTKSLSTGYNNQSAVSILSNNHRRALLIKGSFDNSEQDRNTVVNQTIFGKLRQFTTVSSKWE